MLNGIMWVGMAISFLGLLGLILSIARVARARKAQVDDDALRAEIQKAVPLNLGAFLMSVLGH